MPIQRELFTLLIPAIPLFQLNVHSLQQFRSQSIYLNDAYFSRDERQPYQSSGEYEPFVSLHLHRIDAKQSSQ